LKLKKNDLAGSKTPLTKTTINLKADNTEFDRLNNDRMYRTLKTNNKDLKKVFFFNNYTQTDKSVVRKIEKKGEETNFKKSKIGGENSKTFSTDNNRDKEKDKISINTKIKKPISGGATKTLKDKNSYQTESKKYLTEKTQNVTIRHSVNEKFKEADDKDEKSKKGNHKDLKEPNKHAAVLKNNIKRDKSKLEIDIKKKDDKTDVKTKKEHHEPTVNPFPDQTKVEIIETIQLSEIVKETEIPEVAKEEKIEMAYSENLNLQIKNEIPSSEVNIDPITQTDNIPAVEENSEKLSEIEN
jgi:hypothetical protein